MGIGFVILIHLIAIFILSLVCAVIGSALTYFISKGGGKRRKIILAFTAPFVGFYTFYICWIIGSSVIAANKKVDIGIGDAWYVPLENSRQLLFIDIPEQASIGKENGPDFVSLVSKIEEDGSLILGKTFDNRYFSYDTRTDEVKEFSTEEELMDSNRGKKLYLMDVTDFYSDKKSEIMGSWPVWIGLLSFSTAIGAIYILKQFIRVTFG